MPVTQQQIADAVGTSRGTVDRVLNGRGRVRPELRERILRAAQDMDYRPNAAGRALALARQTAKLGVILQAAETPFMERVLRGVRAGAAEAERLGLAVEIRCLEGMDAECAAGVLRGFCGEGCLGVALMPSEGEILREAVREAVSAQIPVVTFNTDIRDAGQLCFVGQHAEQSGRTVAGLMAQVLRPGAAVLVISGSRSNASHNERIRGFTQELRGLRPDLRLMNVGYNADSARAARDITAQALSAEPDLAGIYIASAGVTGVCDALAAGGRAGSVCLISHDLLEENIERLRSGEISFLIGQDAYAQGYRPIRILIDKLLDGFEPVSRCEYTHIDIRTRYNCRS